MQIRFSRPGGVLLLLAGLLWLSVSIRGQEPQPTNGQQAAAAELPPVPQGVEVLARGPVHEAFATPTTEPGPTKPVAKAPPKPLAQIRAAAAAGGGRAVPGRPATGPACSPVTCGLPPTTAGRPAAMSTSPATGTWSSPIAACSMPRCTSIRSSSVPPSCTRRPTA